MNFDSDINIYSKTLYLIALIDFYGRKILPVPTDNPIMITIRTFLGSSFVMDTLYVFKLMYGHKTNKGQNKSKVIFYNDFFVLLSVVPQYFELCDLYLSLCKKCV